MKKFLVFPNLLFEKEYFKHDIDYFILIEHPIYFGFRRKMKMNFNKLKLVLHRASMKCFADYLRSRGKTVEYIEFGKKIKLKAKDEAYMFDPVDRQLESDLKRDVKKLTILETPNFLTTREEMADYNKKNKKKYFHNNFYKWQVERLEIPYIKKSYDKENRKKLPVKLEVPEIPDLGDEDEKYIKEAQKYIEKKFKNNYGNVNLKFPITYKTSKKWLKIFLDSKLKNYGTYQDAITKRSDTVFHSLLSPMINIGLLNPSYVLKEIIKYYEKNKKVGINNYEGFIRQLIGWREYERMIYVYKYDEIIGKNYFKNNRKLSKDWYEGTTGIELVDNSIKTAFDLGYLHHIIRLMVMSNIMNLSRIEPDEAYKWFMEFSIDSYDWVMIGNVYSMGMWADEGLTMRKPYISSASYIMKMSDYKKGEWADIWTALYYHFINDNKDFFKKTLYRHSVNHLSKMKNKKEVLKLAKDFIKNKTT